jgi:hypothetical protein
MKINFANYHTVVIRINDDRNSIPLFSTTVNATVLLENNMKKP